jgi:hypothetical protein
MNKQGAESPDPAPAAQPDTSDRPVLLCFDGPQEAAQAVLAAGPLLGKRTAIVLSVWAPAASLTSLDPIGSSGRRSQRQLSSRRVRQFLTRNEALLACLQAGLAT